MAGETGADLLEVTGTNFGDATDLEGATVPEDLGGTALPAERGVLAATGGGAAFDPPGARADGTDGGPWTLRTMPPFARACSPDDEGPEAMAALVAGLVPATWGAVRDLGRRSITASPSMDFGTGGLPVGLRRPRASRIRPHRKENTRAAKCRLASCAETSVQKPRYPMNWWVGRPPEQPGAPRDESHRTDHLSVARSPRRD